MGEMVEFASNGSTAGGYLATPESGTGPGVIVIQEWWGLVDHIEDVCDRFAAVGFVALAPDNRGTTLDGLTNLATYLPSVGSAVNEGLASVCQSCVQQEVGSPVITALDASGITVPTVDYTVISTEYDEVVTPWQSQQLTGSNVTDIVLQDQCSLDQDGHAGIVYDHIALRDVLNALDPANAIAPVCSAIGFEAGG